jgi:hypothetical protein
MIRKRGPIFERFFLTESPCFDPRIAIQFHLMLLKEQTIRGRNEVKFERIRLRYEILLPSRSFLRLTFDQIGKDFGNAFASSRDLLEKT